MIEEDDAGDALLVEELLAEGGSGLGRLAVELIAALRWVYLCS